jgi:hypothetical protein
MEHHNRWRGDYDNAICPISAVTNLITVNVSEKAKHNILGGTAARLFKLPPRKYKQRENPAKFGNLIRDGL